MLSSLLVLHHRTEYPGAERDAIKLFWISWLEGSLIPHGCASGCSCVHGSIDNRVYLPIVSAYGFCYTKNACCTEWLASDHARKSANALYPSLTEENHCPFGHSP